MCKNILAKFFSWIPTNTFLYSGIIQLNKFGNTILCKASLIKLATSLHILLQQILNKQGTILIGSSSYYTTPFPQNIEIL